MAKRQSRIFDYLREQRRLLDEEAASEAANLGDAWAQQEAKARAADDAIRRMAQRARQAHQQNVFFKV
jgi:hypothetical protein